MDEGTLMVPLMKDLNLIAAEPDISKFNDRLFKWHIIESCLNVFKAEIIILFP